MKPQPRKHYANGDLVSLWDKLVEPCFMATWWFYSSSVLVAVVLASPILLWIFWR